MKFKPEEECQELVPVEPSKQFLALPKARKKIIVQAGYEYCKLNEQEKLLKARRDKMFRPIVETAAEAYGVEDQDGHIHLQTGEGVEIIRQKKVSATLNTVAAENLLKEKGLYDACVQVVMTYEIDEDKVIEAYNAGKITAQELDSIFTERISYATIVKVESEEIDRIAEARKSIEKGKQPQGEMPEIESGE